MHVLRYAGGYDVQQTGFGKGASSFHTTGNYLTGVSELDDFRLPNLAGYAQVQDKENGDDTHDDTLEALLLDSCTQFDAVIADARAAMAARVGQDKADAAAAAAAAIERVRSTGADMSAALAALTLVRKVPWLPATTPERPPSRELLTDRSRSAPPSTTSTLARSMHGSETDLSGPTE